jgi:hypothetical protein
MIATTILSDFDQINEGVSFMRLSGLSIENHSRSRTWEKTAGIALTVYDLGLVCVRDANASVSLNRVT